MPSRKDKITVMPISKSAKKALSNAEHKASRNRYRKSLLKDALKKAVVSTETPAKQVADVSAKAFSAIDKAAKWGIIHKNKASRLKSQLAKRAPVEAVKPKDAKPAATKKSTAKKTVAKKAPAKKTAK